MAKQPVNIVERHVEKAILGICAAVLLAAIAFFLVSTPNKIELGTDLVGPGEIDQRIRDAGRQLNERLRKAEVEDVEVTDYTPQLEEASSPLALARLEPTIPSPVPYLPPVPDIGEAPPRQGEIRLARVIAPIQLKVTRGRSSLDLLPPVRLNDKDEPTGPPPQPGLFTADVNWVTVAALFDQQKQINVCKKAGYIAERQNPYLVAVDLQRRMRRPDGTWGEWGDVEPYMSRILPPPPTVEIVKGRKDQPIATESTRIRVGAYFALLKRHQADLFRQMFPKKQYGQDWLYPKYDMSVPALDDELCRLYDRDGACEPRPYPVQTDLAPPVEEKPKTDRERLEESKDALDRAFESGRMRDAIRYAEEILDNPAARSRDLDDARGKKIQAENDLARHPDRGGQKPDQPVEVVRSRYQVLWAHDASPPADGGAVSGETYQYRMRVKLYNRFCAVPQDLADAADAAKLFVVGDWSEPTDAVYIEPDTRFFVTGGNPFQDSGAKASVFKWFEGVWVSHTFPLEIGRPISGSAREAVRVVNGIPDRPRIDFDTGTTVVDVDYDYMFRPRKKRSKGRFTIEAPRETIAVIYVDRAGTLRQRIMDADRSSAEYKAFKAKVFKP